MKKQNSFPKKFLKYSFNSKFKNYLSEIMYSLMLFELKDI